MVEDEETRAHVQSGSRTTANAINANAYAASGDDDDDVPEVPIEVLTSCRCCMQEDHAGGTS